MRTRSEFKKMLLTDRYIIWLSDFMKNKTEINDTSFIKKNRNLLGKFDEEMILYLGHFYTEITNCFFNKMPENNSIYYFIKYQHNYYRLNFNGEGISCGKYSEKEYSELKKQEKLATGILSNVTNDVAGNITLFPFIEYSELIQQYDIEERIQANNIAITQLDNIFRKIFGDEDNLYKIICKCLNKEELVFLLKNLQNKSCDTCNNQSCNLDENEKFKFGLLNNDLENKCLAWYNEKLIGKSKVLKITDINRLK